MNEGINSFSSVMAKLDDEINELRKRKERIKAEGTRDMIKIAMDSVLEKKPIIKNIMGLKKQVKDLEDSYDELTRLLIKESKVKG